MKKHCSRVTQRHSNPRIERNHLTLPTTAVLVFGLMFATMAYSEISLLDDAELKVTELPASVERQVDVQPLEPPTASQKKTTESGVESDAKETADKQGTADKRGTADKHGTSDNLRPEYDLGGTGLGNVGKAGGDFGFGEFGGPGMRPGGTPSKNSE
ncbi:MAG: hypothetical protein ABW166_14855 [Sedimenticola sp.]